MRPLFLALAMMLAAAAGQPVIVAQTQAGDLVVARVRIRVPADVMRLTSQGVDLLEMRDGNDVFILTRPAEIRELRRAGWRVQVDDDHTRALVGESGTGPVQLETYRGGYRTVSEIRTLLETRVSEHPQLAELFEYGESWERLAGGAGAGHTLFGIRLTNRLRGGPKPIFFLMAAIHARELTTSELAVRFVDYLLQNYGVDGDATWLLDHHLVVVVPVVNPDGRILAQQGYLQRKNTDPTAGSCSVPNIGVDLNRNSSFKWGTVDGPSQSECAQTYPGPTEASEPETAALQALVRSLFTDERGPLDNDAAPDTTSGVLLTVHSYSDLVLWPWGWSSQAAPNAAGLSAIGRKFAAYNLYTPQQSIQLYPTSGTTDDWAYGELGVAAFTFEVGPGTGTCGGFFPAFSCLDGGTGGSFWPRNLPAFLYAARIAREPYRLALGPTTETVTAAAIAGDRVDLRASIDDRANGGQTIVEAEYYVDVPPWEGGTAIPMLPEDGNFNQTVETATAEAGPFTTRHLIYVRGRDAGGAWGPVRAVFTDAPECSVTIDPIARAFGTAGGTGNILVTAQADCGWIPASDATWITITSGGGTSSGSVSYAVAGGTTVARTGSIMIGSATHTVSQGPPDLIEVAISSPPPAVLPGASFNASDTTRNLGFGLAASSTTRYYLSLDLAKSSTDRLLPGSRSVPALAAGSSSTGTVSVTVPSSTPLGDYYLLACADTTARVAEADEQNNCGASAGQVMVTRPDLSVTDLDNPPGSGAPNGRFSARDTVANSLVAAAGSTTRYYLSLDQVKQDGDKMLSGTRSVPKLSATGSSTGSVTVTIPSNTSAGTYYLLGCADDRKNVVERDETNNCRASVARIQVVR